MQSSRFPGSRLVAAALVAAFAAGCAPADDEAAPTSGAEAAGAGAEASTEAPASTGSPLEGTSWQLVEIQSMSDEVGTIRPEERSDYTLSLAADGSATMQLDCNRATGSWSVSPSADPTNGSFEFGPMAVTQALCPEPSIGEQISAQLQYVTGYLIRDGRLNLSLMADGGILVWEPADIGESFLTEPNPALEAAIRDASPDYTAEIVEAGGGQQARYIYGFRDLNADGTPEVFAYLLGPFFCGSGGCNLLLFAEEGEGYRLVNNFPISRLPVIVSASRRNGWNDLIRMESGGGAEATYLTHHFDGTTYVEGERTGAGAAPPAGQRILAGEYTFDVGIPLAPND